MNAADAQASRANQNLLFLLTMLLPFVVCFQGNEPHLTVLYNPYFYMNFIIFVITSVEEVCVTCFA